MHLLFVHPPAKRHNELIYLPLALGQLIALAEQEGHTVTYLDLHNHHLDPESVEKTLAREAFQACFMSGFAPQVQGMRDITAIIRERQPGIPVVLGGLGVGSTPELSLKYTGADAVATGEGEAIFPDLLRTIAAGEPFHNVKSLTFRHTDGRIVQTPLSPVVEDLDSLPMAAYHHFDIELIARNGYLGDRFPTLASWTSRGCSFRCDYCVHSMLKDQSVMQRMETGPFGKSPDRMRFRSGLRVAEELRFLKDRYGISDFFFVDEEFIVSQRHVEDICQALKPLDITWWTSGRADLATPEKLSIMKEAGCRFINFGIESASPEILKTINRQMRVDKVVKGIAAAREIGLTFQTNFIVGLPGETTKTVDESLEFCRTNDFFFTPNLCHPFPGSKVFEMIRDQIDENTLFDDIANHWDLGWTYPYNLTRLPDNALIGVRDRAMAKNFIHMWVTKNRALAALLSWPVFIGFRLFGFLMKRNRTAVRRIVLKLLQHQSVKDRQNAIPLSGRRSEHVSDPDER